MRRLLQLSGSQPAGEVLSSTPSHARTKRCRRGCWPTVGANRRPESRLRVKSESGLAESESVS
jgi:hypothetical protein